jgi:hypothetical protein
LVVIVVPLHAAILLDLPKRYETPNQSLRSNKSPLHEPIRLLCAIASPSSHVTSRNFNDGAHCVGGLPSGVIDREALISDGE